LKLKNNLKRKKLMEKKKEMTAILKSLKEITGLDLIEAIWCNSGMYAMRMDACAGKRYVIRSIEITYPVAREKYDYLMVIKDGTYDEESFYVKKEWIKDIQEDYTDEEWFNFAKEKQPVWAWNEDNNSCIYILKKYEPKKVKRFVCYYGRNDEEKYNISFLYVEPYYPKFSKLVVY